MKVKKLLNQPISIFDSDRKKWIYILSTLIFIFFFIFIYTPFGLSEEMSDPKVSHFRILSFVLSELLAVFISLYLFQFVILKRYYNKSFTIKRYIKFFLLEMLSISFLLMLFEMLSVYLFFREQIPELQERFVTGTFIDHYPILAILVDGVFDIIPQVFVISYPFMGCVLFFQITELKEEVSELETELKKFKADFIEKETSEITLDLLDENNNIEFTLELSKLLAIESSNQYVVVYYFKDGQVCKQIIRTRLKKFLLELEAYPIYQTHRSYAVNLLNVDQIKSIDKKRVLTFSESPHLNIPVSKTYLETIKTVILN